MAGSRRDTKTLTAPGYFLELNFYAVRQDRQQHQPGRHQCVVANARTLKSSWLRRDCGVVGGQVCVSRLRLWILRLDHLWSAGLE